MFRFTIRDVLWLMVVVGLACGWWIEHRRASWQALIHTREMERLTLTVESLNRRIAIREFEAKALGALLANKQREMDRWRNRPEP